MTLEEQIKEADGMRKAASDCGEHFRKSASDQLRKAQDYEDDARHHEANIARLRAEIEKAEAKTPGMVMAEKMIEAARDFVEFEHPAESSRIITSKSKSMTVNEHKKCLREWVAAVADAARAEMREECVGSIEDLCALYKEAGFYRMDYLSEKVVSAIRALK